MNGPHDLGGKTGFGEEPKSVKQAELETLMGSKQELGNDQPDGTFYARTLPPDKWKVMSSQSLLNNVRHDQSKCSGKPSAKVERLMP